MVINVKYLNEVHVKIECDDSIAYEISDYFSFKIPNAHFNPLVKERLWDGIIRLFNVNNRLLYYGLRHQLIEFAKSRGYEYNEDHKFAADPFSIVEAKEFIDKLKLTLKPRDYQLVSFIKAIRDRKRLFLSPTNSGKSLIIYLITEYLKLKTLIVVPKTSLVTQLTNDFIDYDQFNIKDEITKIYSGMPKLDRRITISTWQSIYKKPEEWFEQFDVIIGDEAHNFQATSLKTLMEKTVNCKYKYGFTGTLDGSLTNKVVLEGLFGKVDKVTTNDELIKTKVSSELIIKCIKLDYPNDYRFSMKDWTYANELEFVITNTARNNFIANLAHSLDGNVMVLFRFVEKHGEILYKMIQNKNKDRSGIYYVYGQTDNVFKDEVRGIVDSQNRAILVASIGTFSEGVNIKNINHIIFAHPSKGRIKVLQSIGRGLRRTEDKTEVTLFDIIDDLSWKSHKNFLLKHYLEREKIYKQEKFNCKHYRVKIKP